MEQIISVKYYFYWCISSVELLFLKQGSEMDLICKTVILFLLVSLSLGLDGELAQSFITIAGPLPSELAERWGLQEQVLPEQQQGPDAQAHLCRADPMASELPRYLRRLRALGVTHCRLLLPWARVLPEGSTAGADGARVRCYRRLLEAVAAAGLRAVLLLHRGPVPSRAAAGAFPELFAEYADFSFRAFGDLVDVWVSFSDLPEVLQSLPYTEPQERVQAVAAAHKGFYSVLHDKVSPAGKESRVFQHDSQIFCDCIKW